MVGGSQKCLAYLWGSKTTPRVHLLTTPPFLIPVSLVPWEGSRPAPADGLVQAQGLVAGPPSPPKTSPPHPFPPLRLALCETIFILI